MFSQEETTALEALGARLRRARLERDESQRRFAARLGVSVPTLRKLEQGNPTVQLGLLVRALSILGALSSLADVPGRQQDLFERWEASQRHPPARQRARRRPR